MKRTVEIHIFEHLATDYQAAHQEPTTQNVTVAVRYEQEQNLAYVALHAANTTVRALIPPLLPVGAPEGCGSVHVEAVISGRLKELGAHRAGQLAEYVVGHVTSVCDPGSTNSESQPGFAPRYDFPQSGAPSFLRSCAIESCGVPADVPEGGMVAGNTEDEIGDEPQGEMT